MKSKSTKEFVSKFQKIEKRINQSFGDFVLFALFLPEIQPTKWDVVVSAPWLKRTNMDAMRAISKILNEELDDDIMKISRIVVLEPNSDFVDIMHKTIQIEHGLKEYINHEFLDLAMKHAFVITSKKMKRTNGDVKRRFERLKTAA